jgi:hypothetical protein
MAYVLLLDHVTMASPNPHTTHPYTRPNRPNGLVCCYHVLTLFTFRTRIGIIKDKVYCYTVVEPGLYE